jgi:hypothetical protein
MRTYRKVTTLFLSLLLGACSGRQQQTAELPDDLKKDLAAASVAGNDLAIASQSRRSVRFVSDIEQWKNGTPVKRPKASHRTVRPTVHRGPAESMTHMAADPTVSVASESSAPAPITVAPAPEPERVIAASPSPEPSSAPVGSTSDGRIGDRGQGGGLGGLLGGIIGTVILRGGHGGIDKCDPRTDGRVRPPMTDIGALGLPLPTGTIFPATRRR